VLFNSVMLTRKIQANPMLSQGCLLTRGTKSELLLIEHLQWMHIIIMSQ